MGVGSSREWRNGRPLTALSPAQMSTGPSGTGAGLMMALSEAVAASIAPVRRYCVHATRATVGDKDPDKSEAP